MKGRRKVKTDKWRLQEQFIKEARVALAAKSNQGHFLQAAVRMTCEEPTGILAGGR